MPINTHAIFAINAKSSKQLAQWLNHPASLTDKLLKITGEVQLDLIAQGWIKADWWGKNLLEIEDEFVFQREIIMKSHGISYWYARSIIPKKCYELDPEFFDRLKHESIKNLIFGTNRVCRTCWITYPIDNQCIEFYWVKKHSSLVAEVIWVRLAEFSFQKRGVFYLVEVMLPALEQCAP